MALMPVRYCHAASTTTRISGCQARMRARSLVMPGIAAAVGRRVDGRLLLQSSSLPQRRSARCVGPSCGGRPEFFSEGVPDLAVLAGGLVGLAEVDDVAGTRQLHVVDLLDAAGPARHDHD